MFLRLIEVRPKLDVAGRRRRQSLQALHSKNGNMPRVEQIRKRNLNVSPQWIVFDVQEAARANGVARSSGCRAEW
jgi:hypothetical protein